MFEFRCFQSIWPEVYKTKHRARQEQEAALSQFGKFISSYIFYNHNALGGER